jgi:hypothetical protein
MQQYLLFLESLSFAISRKQNNGGLEEGFIAGPIV